MKGALLFVAIFAVAMLVIPMIGLRLEEPSAVLLPVQGRTGEASSPPAPSASPAQTPPADLREDKPEAEETERSAGNISLYGVTEFKILDTATGQVNTVPLRDFVRGAVAAEMPASFHPEALKAQAVAAHTFALHNHLVQQAHPDPALRGADFSADPSNMLVYITEKTAKKFYGEKGDYYWSKICEAADSVVSYILEYEDEPIVAAYHAISAGTTEDAANIWTGSAPYLLAVESPGDLLAPDYETTTDFNLEAVREKLLSAYPEMDLSGDPAGWFGDTERSDSGYITRIEVGGVALHGKDIRQLFALRSHNLDIEYLGDRFAFNAYGYGHGVGLSQYGADFMARQGATFDGILMNYYSGAVLKQVKL